MFLSTHERHLLAEQFDMIPPITWEIPSPNNVFTSVNKPRLLTLWENKSKSCHRILMNTWSTMFYRRREAFNKQHIALFKFGLISCLDALEEFNMIHLITAWWSTRGLPCFLDNGKLLTKKKRLLLDLAVESALHTPKTSCCVSYFYFAVARQFTSFIIDIL